MIRYSYPLSLGLLLLFGTTAYLWFKLLSPWGYTPPAHLPPIDHTRQHQLFVYGTLRVGLVRALVVGRSLETKPARLPGYRQVGLDLVPDPTSSVAGERFSVTADELKRLDRYERLGIRYTRIEARLTDGQTVWIYRRL